VLIGALDTAIVSPALPAIRRAFSVDDLLLGWQWLFLINQALSALVIGLNLRFIPAAKTSQKPNLDWAGMLTLGLWLALLTFGINQVDTAHFFASALSLSV
jgi:hypothetical protein